MTETKAFLPKRADREIEKASQQCLYRSACERLKNEQSSKV